jgi:hypothetical protein
MDIERLKEDVRNIEYELEYGEEQNVERVAVNVKCLRSVIDFANEAIARQSVKSEDVQDAIDFMENELEIIESFTSKYEFFSKNISIFKTILAALQAYEPWVSVENEKPESDKTVLLLCEVRPMGRKYVCIGYYAAPKSVESNCDDIEMLEYDEDTDAYYLQEGYYEEIRNWDEYSSIAISDFVIGWKHLPPKGE